MSWSVGARGLGRRLPPQGQLPLRHFRISCPIRRIPSARLLHHSWSLADEADPPLPPSPSTPAELSSPGARPNIFADTLLADFREALAGRRAPEAWRMYKDITKYGAIAAQISLHELTELLTLVNQRLADHQCVTVGRELLRMFEKSDPATLPLEFINQRINFLIRRHQFIAARNVLNTLRAHAVRPNSRTFALMFSTPVMRDWRWIMEIYQRMRTLQYHDDLLFHETGQLPPAPIVLNLDTYNHLYGMAVRNRLLTLANFMWQEINFFYTGCLTPAIYHHRICHIHLVTKDLDVSWSATRLLLACRLPVANDTLVYLAQAAQTDTTQSIYGPIMEFCLNHLFTRYYHFSIPLYTELVQGSIVADHLSYALKLLYHLEARYLPPAIQLTDVFTSEPPDPSDATNPDPEPASSSVSVSASTSISTILPSDSILIYTTILGHLSKTGQFSAAANLVAHVENFFKQRIMAPGDQWVVCLVRYFFRKRDYVNLRAIPTLMDHEYHLPMPPAVANHLSTVFFQLNDPDRARPLFDWLMRHDRPSTRVAHLMVKHYTYDLNDKEAALTLIE
ncbi:hypothetical protein BJ085DRAFT_35430, partial [Dimargaris cristalligena]